MVPLGSSNQASLSADAFNSALKASHQQAVCMQQEDGMGMGQATLPRLGRRLSRVTKGFSTTPNAPLK